MVPSQSISISQRRSEIGETSSTSMLGNVVESTRKTYSSGLRDNEMKIPIPTFSSADKSLTFATFLLDVTPSSSSILQFDSILTMTSIRPGKDQHKLTFIPQKYLKYFFGLEALK